MRIASYHVHTNYCDGANTPEEMIRAAIAAGMTDVALTAHAAWPFASEWHLPVSRYVEYLEDVRRLAAAYRGRIRVLAGFEADYLRGITAPDSSVYGSFAPDVIVGSVHYVPGKGPTPWAVDAPADLVARGIDEAFGGDGKKAVQAYWGAVREMVSSYSFDIVGHLDVIRKRNGTLRFFDEETSWYRRELAETAKAIARAGKIVELNTGGIARKAIDGVYPSDELLSLLRRHDVRVTISSDAHGVADIACAYDKARQAARVAGFTGLSYLEEGRWITEPLPLNDL